MAKKKLNIYAEPTKLQRILVRRGLDYDAAAEAINKHVKTGEPVSVSSGYLCKIANGARPSLRLGRVIVRWAKNLREKLVLDDLGIETV